MNRNYRERFTLSDEEIGLILKGDYNLLVKRAEEFGKYLAKEKKLKTSQFRKIFGEIKKIFMKGFSENTIKDLLLLKPRLSYTAERHKTVRDLRDVLSKMIDKIVTANKKEYFENFVNFVEAVLAYHKGYGGRD